MKKIKIFHEDQGFMWFFWGKIRETREKIKNSVWTLARKPKSTFLCLINEGTGNLITLVPRLFLFVDEDEDFIRTVMQNKSGTWGDLCFWFVKTSYIHIANPCPFWFLCFCIPDLAWCCRKTINSSSVGSIEEH